MRSSFISLNKLEKINILFGALESHLDANVVKTCCEFKQAIESRSPTASEQKHSQGNASLSSLVEAYENALTQKESKTQSLEGKVFSLMLGDDASENHDDIFTLLKHPQITIKGACAVAAAGALADMMVLTNAVVYTNEEKQSERRPGVSLEAWDFMLLALLQTVRGDLNVVRKYPTEDKNALAAALYYYHAFQIDSDCDDRQVKQPFRQTIDKIFKAYLARGLDFPANHSAISNALLQASVNEKDEQLFGVLYENLRDRNKKNEAAFSVDAKVALLIQPAMDSLQPFATAEQKVMDAFPLLSQLQKDLSDEFMKPDDRQNVREIRNLVAILASVQELVKAVQSMPHGLPHDKEHYDEVYRKAIARCDKLSRAVRRETYKRNVIKLSLFLLAGAAVAAAMIFLPPLFWGAVLFAITLEGLLTPIMSGIMLGGVVARSCDAYLEAHRTLASPVHKAYKGFFDKVTQNKISDGRESKHEKIVNSMAQLVSTPVDLSQTGLSSLAGGAALRPMGLSS